MSYAKIYLITFFENLKWVGLLSLVFSSELSPIVMYLIYVSAFVAFGNILMKSGILGSKRCDL
jgi:H+/gluconate symporter-like permease